MASSPSTVKQESSVKLTPEQQQLYSLGMPLAEQYAATPVQQYTGQTIAGFTAPETQAQQTILNQTAPTAAALAEQAATTNSQMMDPARMDVANNPYVQNAAGAVTDQVNRGLAENILPAIRSGSTVAGGQYSGGATRQGLAEGTAIGRSQTGLAEELAKMQLGAYSLESNNVNQAVARNPDVITSQTIAPQLTAQVGAQQRALEQAQLDKTVNDFYTAQSLPFLQAGDIFGLANGMQGATNVSKTTGSQASNPLGMLGLGMTGLGMLGGGPLGAIGGKSMAKG